MLHFVAIFAPFDQMSLYISYAIWELFMFETFEVLMSSLSGTICTFSAKMSLKRREKRRTCWFDLSIIKVGFNFQYNFQNLNPNKLLHKFNTRIYKTPSWSGILSTTTVTATTMTHDIKPKKTQSITSSKIPI